MLKEITNKTWLLGLVNHTGLKDNYLWVIPSLSLEKHNIISFKGNCISPNVHNCVSSDVTITTVLQNTWKLSLSQKLILHLHVAVVKLHNVQMFDNNDYIENKQRKHQRRVTTLRTGYQTNSCDKHFQKALNKMKGTDFEELQYLYSSFPFLSPLIRYSHVVLWT